MKSVTPFNALRALGLADWNTVAIGCRRGWVTKLDVVNWAVEWLAEHPTEARTPVLLLAGGESLSDDEVSSLCERLVPPSEINDPGSLEKWRLAMLVELAANDLSWDEKVTKLEELRAVFGFPNDMHDCTRYGDTGTDPLDAMTEVINRLKANWHVV